MKSEMKCGHLLISLFNPWLSLILANKMSVLCLITYYDRVQINETILWVFIYIDLKIILVDSSYFIQKSFTVLLSKAGFLIIINFEIVYNNQNKCIFSIRNFKDLCILSVSNWEISFFMIITFTQMKENI